MEKKEIKNFSAACIHKYDRLLKSFVYVHPAVSNSNDVYCKTTCFVEGWYISQQILDFFKVYMHLYSKSLK